MELLIALVVFSVGLMVFGSLLYGAAKVFSKKKNGFDDLSSPASKKAYQLRINRSQNIYSFK